MAHRKPLILNTDKTVCLVLGTWQRRATVPDCSINLRIGDKSLQQVPTAKLLGLTVDETLSWDAHIDALCKKISNKLVLLCRLKKCMPCTTLLMLYNSIVLPHFDYADIIWGTAADKYVTRLYKLQKRAARIIASARRFAKSEPIFQDLKWMPLKERIHFHTATMMHKAMSGQTPDYITSKFTHVRDCSSQRTREGLHDKLRLPKPHLEVYRRSFDYRGASLWNDLDHDIKMSTSTNSFKFKYVKSYWAVHN